MTIVYKLGNNLYINVTNACSCDCIFCLRNKTDGVGNAPSLWLEREPSIAEIVQAIDKACYALCANEIEEIVFCGFGEPMMRADVVIHVCEYIKSLPIYKQHNNRNHSSLYGKPAPLVRINTNGLAFLMHPGFDISKLATVDTVSISLNADTPEEYLRIARPKYGIESFASLLDFARQASVYTSVVFSVVEGSITPQRLANCRRIADDMGIPLRVRPAE